MLCSTVFVQVLKLKCAFNTSTRRKYKIFIRGVIRFGFLFIPPCTCIAERRKLRKTPLTIIAIKYQMWNIHVSTINTKCCFPYGGWRKGGGTEGGPQNMRGGIVNKMKEIDTNLFRLKYCLFGNIKYFRISSIQNTIFHSIATLFHRNYKTTF